MREWWNNLALREKQMVSLGTLFLGAFLIYLILWSPLDNKVSSLRDQIPHNQELLNWMKDANNHIEALEKKSKTNFAKHASGSLLNIVQQQIKISPVANTLDQLHQAENDSVQLKFKKVNFDKLITWLITLTQQQGLAIIQMTVTPATPAGMVEAEVTLH